MPAIDSTLQRIKRQTEEENAAALASRLGLSYALLDDYPFNLDVLSLLPLEEVEKHLVAVYVKVGKKVKVAMVHPEDPDTQAYVLALSAEWGAEIDETVVSQTTMEGIIRTYAKLLHEREEAEKQERLASVKAEERDYLHKIKTVSDLQEEASRVSNVTELLDLVLASAYNLEASDIHLEPGERAMLVRFRIDGVLQRVLEIPMAQHHQVVSRIKVSSGIKLDETNVNQDGRFSMTHPDGAVDIRVSTIPTGYGEGVVLRILRQDTQARSIDELGFSAQNLETVRKIIRKPYGLILVTGPTGSGKSTTLYALLQQLNSPEKKIITLEDPIEYRIEGIQQSQINPLEGFTFAEGLKGALRQDPDVVMVGEIRDPETATIALNASLTGHLVLSTLHTNNAVTVHTRLLEMGIEPFLLSGSIQMIIAQRLVRRLVPGSTPDNPQYKGRIIISEILCPTQEFEQAVIVHRDQETLEEIAVAGGMIPILKDGMEKVRAGLTTEAEVARVTEV